MKRLIIIGEGQTEQAFCKDVLQPHFVHKHIYIDNPTISKSGGGIVAWKHLMADINRFLKGESQCVVTLLIDFYGINDKHEFPAWEAAKMIPDKSKRMAHLESAMADEIGADYQHRFIPYIQVHEFEAVLFSDRKIFERCFTANEYQDYALLEATFNEYDNPEDINDSPETAPSKRMEKIVRDYTTKPSTKSFWGPMLAQEIGLQKIRSKCPRFNAWINKLENI